MIILVTGSRDKKSYYPFFKKVMDNLTKNLKKVEIVSGDAGEGADNYCKRWTFERMRTHIIYHADWKKYRKAAGPKRNSEMVEESEAKICIAFWDGESPGTADCIKKAKKAGMEVRVFYYLEEE